jgi:formylmethanofuran dehydrogenase subunit E
MHVGDALALDLPRTDKRLLIVVETDGCFADGVSVATGCWLGRRTLRLVDCGRVGVTAVDTWSRRAVRVTPHPLARVRALAYAPALPDRWHAQLAGYQVMRSDELLRVEPVALSASLESLLGKPGVRVACVVCGEDVLNGRELATPAGPVCRACAMEPYSRPVEADVSGTPPEAISV